VTREPREEPGKKNTLSMLIDLSERVVYYGAAFALVITLGMLFFSTAQSILSVAEEGALGTSLAVLDRVLLIFIFVELLATIGTIVREREVVAEPFLLIGLIAVVRRVLTVTAEIERSLGTPKFDSLVLELGVLTALIVALTGALYFTRRSERGQSPQSGG
jgi:uncharacterized membrane protein (DUF373 family)